jgi:GH18 family chitinase
MAIKDGTYDEQDGSYFYWDKSLRIFWSWDTADAIGRKIRAIVGDSGLGGVFAWGLGEDAPKFEHLKASTEALARLQSTGGAKSYHHQRNEL